MPATSRTPAPSPAERLAVQDAAPRPAEATVGRLGRPGADWAVAMVTAGCTVSPGGPMIGGPVGDGPLSGVLSAVVEEVSDPTRSTAAIVVPSLMV